MNLIKVVKVGNVEYIFNGKTLELFKKEDDNIFLNYLKDDDAVDAPYTNTKKVDCLFKLTLNISNSCNLKCKYCYANHGDYGRSSFLMSKDTVHNIIQDIKNRGFNSIYVVSLFGGEPTMNYDVLEYAINCFVSSFDKIFKFEITTNGTFLNEERIMFLSEHNVKLVVSLDGPENITDFLRGSGSYKIAKNVIDIAKKNDYKDLEVSATYTNAHLQMGYSYENIINYFKDMEVNVSISKVSIDKNSSLYIDDTISKDDFVDIVKEDLYAVYNRESKILNPYIYTFLNSMIFGIKSYQFCDELQTNYALAYDYDGKLYNCFRLWGKEEFQINEINEITSSSLVDKNSKKNTQKCSDCWARYLCKECIAEIALGENILPIQNGECKNQMMYEICLIEFIKFINKYDINKLINNFKSFLRYQ